MFKFIILIIVIITSAILIFITFNNIYKTGGVGEFDNITFEDNKSINRIKKELKQILNIYNDVTFNDGVVSIPSKELTFKLPEKYPLGTSRILSIKYGKLIYMLNVQLSPYTKLIDCINNLINTKSNYYSILINMSLFKDGEITNKYINIDSKMTVKMFVDSNQTKEYMVNTIKFNNKTIFSNMINYKNKKMWDIIDDDSLNLFVSLFKVMSEDELITFMQNPLHVTTHLSESKIVSTIETGFIDIVASHLRLYIHNIESILQNVFKKDGVHVKFINTNVNPVIFYIESYLNKFTDKLKFIEEFKDIEDLPNHLLEIMGNIVLPSNNLYFTIMLILFGGIDTPPTTFTPDENVIELYNEYLDEIRST